MYNESSDSSEDSESNRRRLLSLAGSGEAVRRVLATASTDKCAAKVWTLKLLWTGIYSISALFVAFDLLLFRKCVE